MRNIESPVLDTTVTHNFVQGNNRGLVYGLERYANRLYVLVHYIGGATSATDRQLWALKTDDLSVLERLTLGDDSGLFTITPQGKFNLVTTNNNIGGFGDSDSKMYVMNPMDISGTAPTIVVDIPATERFNAISFRRTQDDILSGLGYANGKFPIQAGVGKHSADYAFTGTTPLTITHNLNSTDIILQFKTAAGERIEPDTVNNYTANTVDVTFATTNTNRVIIIG